MEEKYPMLNLCLLRSEKISFLHWHHGLLSLQHWGEHTMRSQVQSGESVNENKPAGPFSPMSFKAKILILCSYCKCMEQVLSATVPEGIPIACFQCCSYSSLHNSIWLAQFLSESHWSMTTLFFLCPAQHCREDLQWLSVSKESWIKNSQQHI